MNVLWEWLRRFVPLKGRERLPPIRYSKINRSSKPPRNQDVKDGEFHLVFIKGRQHWALFRCPCGCGDVVTLSLQFAHRPHWAVRKSRPGRPTLSPSVWRDRGCYSHFWVTDGRIYWAANTGTSPAWQREGF